MALNMKSTWQDATNTALEMLVYKDFGSYGKLSSEATSKWRADNEEAVL